MKCRRRGGCDPRLPGFSCFLEEFFPVGAGEPRLAHEVGRPPDEVGPAPTAVDFNGVRVGVGGRVAGVVVNAPVRWVRVGLEALAREGQDTALGLLGFELISGAFIGRRLFDLRHVHPEAAFTVGNGLLARIADGDQFMCHGRPFLSQGLRGAPTAGVVHADDGGRTRGPCRPKGSRPATRPFVRSTSTVPAPGCHTGAGAEDQSGAPGRRVRRISSPIPWFTPPQRQSHGVSGVAEAQLGEPQKGVSPSPGCCWHRVGQHGVRRYQSRHPTAPVSSRSRSANMTGMASSSMVTVLQ